MGLFDKLKKEKPSTEASQPKAVNKIEDKELKERIADSALNILEKDVDYIERGNTAVEFGYLFDF